MDAEEVGRRPENSGRDVGGHPEYDRAVNPAGIGLSVDVQANNELLRLLVLIV
jgi:hypothetical protein